MHVFFFPAFETLSIGPNEAIVGLIPSVLKPCGLLVRFWGLKTLMSIDDRVGVYEPPIRLLYVSRFMKCIIEHLHKISCDLKKFGFLRTKNVKKIV